MTFQCETCGRTFLNEHALHGHQRVHKDEGRAFLRAAQRQRMKLAQALTRVDDVDARKKIREAMQLGDAMQEVANVD